MLLWSTVVVVVMVVPRGFAGGHFDWCKHDCDPGVQGMPWEKHTMCTYQAGGGPQCASYVRGLSDTEKQQLLNLHNRFRQTVATGQEKRGVGGSQPSAANMMEMVWDDELAEIAQRWADQCMINAHDSCRKTMDGEDAGQNLAGRSGTGMEYSREDIINDRMKAMYDEVRDLPPSVVNSYRGTEKKTGHYTQFVWALSSKVGCGMSHLSGWSFVVRIVCNYKERGNYVGEPIYIKGAAASRCPSDSVPSTTYRGLCKANGNVGSAPKSQMDAQDKTGNLEQTRSPAYSVPKDRFAEDGASTQLASNPYDNLELNRLAAPPIYPRSLSSNNIDPYSSKSRTALPITAITIPSSETPDIILEIPMCPNNYRFS